MKRENGIEVKEEPPACPGRQGSYKLAAIRPFLRQRGRNARNDGKINMLAKKELSIRKKQGTITNYFKQV